MMLVFFTDVIKNKKMAWTKKRRWRPEMHDLAQVNNVMEHIVFTQFDAPGLFLNHSTPALVAPLIDHILR